MKDTILQPSALHEGIKPMRAVTSVLYLDNYNPTFTSWARVV
jgi:hypothetical protein